MHIISRSKNLPVQCVPEERQFKQKVFMGGPGTREDVARLHIRLDEALVIVGGLQQPDHPTSDEDEARHRAERSNAVRDLCTIAEDILCALGLTPRDLMGPNVGGW